MAGRCGLNSPERTQPDRCPLTFGPPSPVRRIAASMTDLPTTHVLIVDDNASDIALIIAKLKHAGLGTFDAVSVGSLLAAKPMLAARHFDVVLLDLLLPDVQEFDAVTYILERHPSTAVVVLTGVADDERGLHAVRIGAQDYIVKQTYHHQGIFRRILYAVERQRRLMATMATNTQPAEP